jgi:hypothetical protein
MDRGFALDDPALNVPLRVLPGVPVYDINVLDDGSAASRKYPEYSTNFALVSSYQNLYLILFLNMQHFLSYIREPLEPVKRSA